MKGEKRQGRMVSHLSARFDDLQLAVLPANRPETDR